MTLKDILITFVDVEMIPSKVSFFLGYGYFGAITPFMNVFYISLGLTAAQAGIISGVSMATSSLFNPLWSIIADVTGHRKLVFVIICAGAATTVFSLPWVGADLVNQQNVSACALGNGSEHATTLRDCPKNASPLDNDNLFHSLLALSVVSWAFFTSVRCYVDGLVANVISTREEERSYGRQRVFCTIGYLIMNVAAGVICDYYQPSGMSRYTAIFYVSLPCIIFLVPWGFKLIDQGKWADEIEMESHGVNREDDVTLKQQIKKLAACFKKSDSLVFFLSIVVSGLLLNVYNCFFFVFMKEAFSPSNTIMVTGKVVAGVSDMIFLVLANRLINIFRGEIPTLTIGIFSFFPRYVIMSYVTDQWHAIALQSLHGLGMGLSWTAAIGYANEIFPVEIRVTGITFITSVEFVLSNAVDNMVGGVLHDLFGGRILFRSASIVAVTWSTFMALYFGTRRFIKEKKLLRPANMPTNPQGISNVVQVNEHYIVPLQNTAI